jgi:LacI family transcriptional regulator
MICVQTLGSVLMTIQFAWRSRCGLYNGGVVGHSKPAARALATRSRVALIVETSLAPGREILRGITQYVRERGSWSIAHEPRSLEESASRWLQRWSGDGIIARVQDESIAREIAAVGVPVVDCLGVVRNPGFPLVHTDDEAIGRLGAGHLLEQGFRRFGFFGIEGENWSDRRGQAFASHVVAAGFSCVIYKIPRHADGSQRWEESERELASWLAQIPKPAGVMIASDQLGPYTLEACRRANAMVPDDIGVIGVDNDEPLCEVSDPPLSSIWPDHRRVGYEAARLLDQMIRGAQPPSGPVLLPPRGVVPRRSTDALAIDDRALAQAVRYIREHGCDAIEVADVVKAVGVSRTVLQRRFRMLLGRSVHDEIVRVRLVRARELLQQTDLPLIEIAERTGFRYQEYMGVVFRRHLRQTPGGIRKLARGR